MGAIGRVDSNQNCANAGTGPLQHGIRADIRNPSPNIFIDMDEELPVVSHHNANPVPLPHPDPQ
jgi:hypothetical protein